MSTYDSFISVCVPVKFALEKTLTVHKIPEIVNDRCQRFPFGQLSGHQICDKSSFSLNEAIVWRLHLKKISYAFFSIGLIITEKYVTRRL